MNCLRPLITQWSPSFTARVCIAASGTLYGSQRSDAPRGSVRQCASRNCGSSTRRLNHLSCRWWGARLRSSTDTFQFCTSLSARPESPRAISSEISAKVCTSEPGSRSVPPNSSGTPRVRMPILSAPCRIAAGRRVSGFMSHSRCQFDRINGMTTSSTNARQEARMRFCSSERGMGGLSSGEGRNTSRVHRLAGTRTGASRWVGTKRIDMRPTLLAAFGAIALSLAPAVAAPVRSVAPDDINSVEFNGGKNSEAVNIRAQVLLDRARFSPGVIDGHRGENFSNALRAFQEQDGLKESGELDTPTWEELGQDAEPAVIEYTITERDGKGPFADDI